MDFSVLASGFGALEGPVVDADGTLFVSDLKRGVVHSISPTGAVAVVTQRSHVGGICLHADGGLVLSGQSVVHHRGAQGRLLYALSDVAERPNATAVGFNDLTADRRGRVVAGILRRNEHDEPAPGELVLINGPHDGTVIHDRIHPNGLSFSADGHRLFAVDTFGRRVVVFDVPAVGEPVVSGELSTSEVPGLPDGLAIDVEGGVWVAFYRGACVARFDPDSGSVRQFEVPALKPLSLCFAGPDRDILLVVTGSDGESLGQTGSVLRAAAPAPCIPIGAVRI
jgi:sugar lactone lactonase YvrE